jgi:hypothetical protein
MKLGRAVRAYDHRSNLGSVSGDGFARESATDRGFPPPVLAFLGHGGQSDAGGAVRGNHPAAGKDRAPVVEHDHAVAQQAPSLLGVEDDGAGGIAVPAVGRGARGAVGTQAHLWSGGCRWARPCGAGRVAGRFCGDRWRIRRAAGKGRCRRAMWWRRRRDLSWYPGGDQRPGRPPADPVVRT